MSLIYAIGDVHGCYDQLLVLLAKIEAHAGHNPYRAVFLGDYIDRGPKSREVVNQVRGLVNRCGGPRKWQAIKGNHEAMMAASIAGNDSLEIWQCNGGEQTLASYADRHDEMREHAAWLSSLPLIIETENHIFVHAGLSPRYSLEEQPEEILLWIRNWEDADHDFGKHVVYGHTPRKTPKLLANSSGLDTGAFYFGTLTAGVFDADKCSGPIEILDSN
jgi:serine/threonine protein phosphatase 1